MKIVYLEIVTTTTTVETTTAESIADELTGEWNVVAGDGTGNEVIVSITDDVVTVLTTDPATGLISMDTGSFDDATGTITIGGTTGKRLRIFGKPHKGIALMN